nr:FAD-dependent monooxygenase [Nonomuraea typhae]
MLFRADLSAALRGRHVRIFLLGDAAHVWPATGGFAGQACVLDAHNLAWKLAATLDGTAGPGLLDSYADERLPIARISMDDSLRRMAWFHTAAGGADKPRDHTGTVCAPAGRSWSGPTGTSPGGRPTTGFRPIR